MAKLFLKVGYSVFTENQPGIVLEEYIERSYKGDMLRNTMKPREGEYLQTELYLENRWSIVADAYMFENFSRIRYVEYLGVCWKVVGVDVQRPRIILSLGGVYNKQMAGTPGYSGGNSW